MLKAANSCFCTHDDSCDDLAVVRVASQVTMYTAARGQEANPASVPKLDIRLERINHHQQMKGKTVDIFYRLRSCHI